MSFTPSQLLRGIRRFQDLGEGVKCDAVQANWNKFPWALGLVMAVNVACVIFFWRIFSPNSSMEAQWVNAVGWLHVANAAFLLSAALMLWLLKLIGGNTDIGKRVFMASYAVAFLLFTISLAVVGQWVTSSMTSYLMGLIGVSMLYLIRPVAAVALFIGAYTVFSVALGWFQPNLLHLTANRVNGLSFTVLAMLISILQWRNFVINTTLRNNLSKAHREVSEKNDQLAFMAGHDALTGLHNRREFFQQAELKMAQVKLHPMDVHLIMLDIDHFKALNDKFGHPFGDTVIKHVAQVLQSGLRESDIVGRVGGEEFMALLPHTNKDQALKLAEQLRQTLAQECMTINSEAVHVTASLGIAGSDTAEVFSLGHLYETADRALYEAKNRGRNRVKWANPAL